MSEIILEKKDHVTIITINRPEVMNCLSPATSKEMSLAINDFDEDADQWVCIITGTGGNAFCAGNDLKFQAKHGGDAVAKGYVGVKGSFGGMTHRFECFKPFIAAVNGLALGGGFELVLACDIVIASENASFGLPEPRVGLLAGAGGPHRLPRQIPYHLAMGMLLTSQRLTAREAAQYGLVNEVVPHVDHLLPVAERWAAEIAKASPLALRATKEAAVCGLGLTLQDAMSHKFPGEVRMRNSEDYIEGPRAFAEKRPPQWKGR